MAHNEGNTPAAWTTVAILLVGVLVGAIGLVAGSWPVFWIGGCLLVVGLIVGKIVQVATRPHAESSPDAAHS